jgi:hypothetical protein
MGTSISTVCCPVRLDDFVYETPGHKRTAVKIRTLRKARQKRVLSPDGSPPGPWNSKSKVCRRLVFAKKRRAATGMSHEWKPSWGVLNRMWCSTKRHRRRDKKKMFHKPIAMLR